MNSPKRKTKGTPDAVDVHVGKRLRIRRSLLGLSQEKLSSAIGLTFQQIQKYECGTNRISAGRLYQFSKILAVPVSYFFENVGEQNYHASFGFADQEQENFLHQDITKDKETIELIRTYYAIKNTDIRKDFIKFMKSIAERTNEDSAE